MIELRPLNRIELYSLIQQAPKDETKNLNKFLKEHDIDAYEFLNNSHVVYRFGLIINTRPAYMAHVAQNGNAYEIWSVVNSEVKEQKTLYKYSKQAIDEALKQFSPIFATMEKTLLKNIAWTKRMGFKQIHEDEKVVVLKIEK